MNAKGGGKVRTPQEAENTLQSKAYARFVDLISEGPIEGFANQAGVTLVDARLFSEVQPTLNEAGELVFDPAKFDVEVDDQGFTFHGLRLPGGSHQPLFSNSQGYPFGPAGEIRVLIDGDFNEDIEDADEKIAAEVYLLVSPRNEAEQVISRRTITATAHGFSVGDRLRKTLNTSNEVVWTLMGATEGYVLGYEYREVTAVPNENQFVGSVVPIQPEGVARGFRVRKKGKNYATAKLVMPSTVAQAIFLDDTPLADPSSLEWNFINVKLDYRLGEETQEPLLGFEQTETIVSAEQSPVLKRRTEPSTAPAWVKTLTGDWDELIINLVLPDGLYRYDLTNGDILSIGDGFNEVGQPVGGSTENMPPVIKITQQLMVARPNGTYPDPSTVPEVPFGANNGLVVVRGKTMSAYELSVRGTLLKAGASGYGTNQYRLNFYRTTKDDEEFENPSSRRSSVRVNSIIGLINVKMMYPFCALMGMEIEAEQFSRIPVRAYRVKLLKVPVPSNYFPPYSKRERLVQGRLVVDYRRQPEYCRGEDGSGVYDENGEPIEQYWDGTFYESWTNNPAWLTHALVTQERIGLGGHISGANKWLFYRIGRYCDEPLNSAWDGLKFTSKEPRFTCSCYFQTVEDAWKVLADLASSFAGYVYYAGGAIIPIQDRPRTPRFSFSPANVEEGLFTYSGVHRNGRYSAVIVKYAEPTQNYELTPVIVQDEEMLARIGWRPLERAYFGCTSHGQALRYAKRLLLTSKNLTDSVNYTTGLLGSVLRPGDVVEIYDPARSSLPFGGRITDLFPGNPDQVPVITLDRYIAVESLNLPTVELFRTYGIVCHKPTGAPDEKDLQTEADLDRYFASQLTHPLRIKAFGKSPRGFTTVLLEEAIPTGVERGAVWGLRRFDVQPQTFQVVTVEEISKHKFQVFAIEYQHALYNAVDFDEAYTEPPINPDLDGWKRPYPPRNLIIHVHPRLGADGQRIYILNVSWSPPEKGFAKAYRVDFKRSLGNYQFFTDTPLTNVEFTVTEPDSYCVQVRTIGITDTLSSAVEACSQIGVITADNKEIISGLELHGQGNLTLFSTGDANFDWRVNWSEATSEYQTGVPPALPPGVLDYEVSIYDLAMVQLWVGSRRDSSFILTLDANKTLVNGPHREFIIGVQARTTDGGLSLETRLRVKNEPPAVPIFTYEADENGYLLLKFLPVLAPDFSHFNVWLHTTPAFIPADEFLVYSGASTVASIALTPGTTYYVRVAALDVIAKNSLDCLISDEFSVVGRRIGTMTVWDFMGLPWS